MYLKKTRDLLKSCLKNRRRITEALIVTFLITGSVGYSQTVDGNSPKITVSDNDTVLTISETGVIDGSESMDTGLTIDGDGNIGTAGQSGNGIIVESGVSGTSIENTGVIRGSIAGENDTGTIIATGQGNGIYDSSALAQITNRGLISGNAELQGGSAYADAKESANGVYGSIAENNSGLIRGYVSLTPGTKSSTVGEKQISFSGNGVGYSGTISKISNSGTIMGSESAIAAAKITSAVNYGVLAGKEIYGNGTGYASVLKVSLSMDR